jgi:toxin ParE1/3/4
MKGYKLSEEAKQDLIQIHQYGTRTFGETQADKYFNGFFEYFDRIAENPYSFPSIDIIRKGYRRAAYGSDSIYYRIANNTIEIIAIVGQQDLDGVL